MTFQERLKAKFGKDLPVSNPMFSGKQGLTSKQREAVQRGPGHKRAPDETNIFKELNDMKNMLNSDISDEEEKKDPIDQ